MYLNKALIIGNLTRDPELKALPSGTKVCSFGLATNRTYKDKDGQRKDSTEFHNIVAFAKLGELSAQYLKKGQQALVEGRIQTRSWDAQNGEKKYRTEIIAENIQFGFKSAGAGSAASVPGASGAGGAGKESPVDEKGKDGAGSENIEYPSEEINPDDIPF
ncbi:MAG: single-strand DNA-binding protein [Candidatus Parcubacteria bacterium]|jgi:single-strand DNA-binding protein|nr:single-strand DNA-binding protein [Candidatus Parcubacteria bacterium]